MTDNPFVQRYKKTDSSQLLHIIDSPNDYQPLAVEAAQFVLESRQLTVEQLSDAKEKQNLILQNKINQQQKVLDIENKFKLFTKKIADKINPIQYEESTTNKLINYISFYIGTLFLYQLYNEFGFLKSYFTNEFNNSDFTIFFYFLPFIFLPIGGILFWLKKKIGWILVVMYFTYSLLSNILMVIKGIIFYSTDVHILDKVFPTTSLIIFFILFVIYSIIVWTLCKKDVRLIYNVDKRNMYISLIIAVGIILLFSIKFYFST